MQFETNYEKFVKKINQLTHMRLEFWQELKSSGANLNKLMNLGLDIAANEEELNKIFILIRETQPNNFRMLKIYGRYLSDIANN